MLKECVINNEKITVPVPILNVGDMIDWADSLGSEYGGVVTKILLDGKDISLQPDRTQDLGPESLVVLNIDTPTNLSREVVTAVISMLEISSIVIKDLAVSTWKNDLISLSGRKIVEDLKMIKELIESINSLDVDKIEFDFVKHTTAISKMQSRLNKSLKENNPREFSSLLLNELDPFLKNLKLDLQDLYVDLVSG